MSDLSDFNARRGFPPGTPWPVANSQTGRNLEQPGSSTPDPETPCPTCGAQRDESCKYVSADSPELAGLTRVGAGWHPSRRDLEGVQ